MKIRKILIVDDEKTITSYLEKKLAKLGYAVSTAEDGEQALEKAFADLPDLVLLDVKLPILNGHEVCRKLRADSRTATIPVLMLSAKAQSDEIDQGLASGADKYLCKPMGFPDILKEIKEFETDRE
ncbi:MAG: response regulator [Pseudomonadota bacterium]